MSRFLEYINEKTYRIGGDVDYIYKKLFQPYMKLLPDIDKFINKVNKSNSVFGEMNSDELKSKDCKKAHKENPILITAGVFNTSSYTPSKSLIKLALNYSVIDVLNKHRSKEEIESMIGSATSKRFFNELSEPNIKGTIYHELSHWINDTIHNRHISKRLDKSLQFDDLSILLKYGSTLFTDYEIDAQVHAIKQLKRNYKKNWDKLSWMDIVSLKGNFNVIFTKLKTINKKEQTAYFKALTKRLNRENLLGKGLKNTFFDAIRKA